MKRTKRTGQVGFTLVEIMIVVAIIGLLAAIAVPNFMKARAASQQTACINNMRQLSAAVNEWALETGQMAGNTTANYQQDLSPYIQLNSNSSIPLCPAGGTYTVEPVGNNPQVDCTLSGLAVNPHRTQ